MSAAPIPSPRTIANDEPDTTARAHVPSMRASSISSPIDARSHWFSDGLLLGAALGRHRRRHRVDGAAPTPAREGGQHGAEEDDGGADPQPQHERHDPHGQRGGAVGSGWRSRVRYTSSRQPVRTDGVPMVWPDARNSCSAGEYTWPPSMRTSAFRSTSPCDRLPLEAEVGDRVARERCGLPRAEHELGRAGGTMTTPVRDR